ncbi:MAG: MBL fold metallo-hydrolase [Ignavibacteria bacterium]|nr:MBL fold metallo-hydrolase [Ignavibacteria bacterium]
MKVKFWGTRGSIPVPGRSTMIYGGNTPSIQVTSSGGEQIFLDAGSGFREAGIDLMRKKSKSKIYLFMSHFHWDHVLGLPFFPPLYDENNAVQIYGMANNQKTVEEVIDLLIRPPLFPITKAEFKASVTFENISPNDSVSLGDLTLKTFEVNHQCCTLAYRIDEGNKSFVYITDNEIKYSKLNPDSLINDIAEHNAGMIEFCKDTDYIVHDTTYTFEDYSNKIGWGHSNNLSGAILSSLAGVKNLILFHYDPEYNDEKVELILNETKAFLKKMGSKVNCIASRDGLELEV